MTDEKAWEWSEDESAYPEQTLFIHNNANGLTVFIDRVYVLRVNSIQDGEAFSFPTQYRTVEAAMEKGVTLMDVAIEEFEHGLPELT